MEYFHLCTTETPRQSPWCSSQSVVPVLPATLPPRPAVLDFFDPSSGLEDAAAVCASFSDSALLLSLPRSRLRSASFDDALHDLSLGPLATATAASLAARAFMFLNQHPAPRRSVPGTWLWAAT